MEITTQQMEALLQLQEQQAQFPRRNTPHAEGFEAMLASQMADVKAPVQSHTDPALTGVTLFGNLLESEERNSEADPDMAVMRAAMDQAADALDLWDNYANILGNSANDSALRDAYSLLEGIDSQIAQLRGGPAMGKSPVFDAMVNELEVLSATEKFKFNRGDYFI